MAIDEDEEPSVEEQNERPLKQHQKTKFPVVLTTYQLVINDRAELARYHWASSLLTRATG